MKYKTILIINLGGIGDVLLSTPALRAIKNTFPASQISMLVIPHVFEVISGLSYINNIYIFFKEYSPLSFFKNIYTLFKLRRERFDLLINMRTMTSAAGARKLRFLISFINPRIKAGRDTEGRGIFFDIKIPETDKGDKYEMEYDIETVAALGAKVTDRSIDFNIDKQSADNINKILEAEGIGNEDILIGIHPGGEPSRRWPVENFSKLIKKIKERINCKFVITGIENERHLIDRLITTVDFKLANTAGRLNIKELGCLIKRCNLYISNDTGPMHIAAILKTPLVAIFGPGYLTRFDPRHISDKAVVFYKKVDCAPCNKIRCGSMRCLKVIPMGEVTQAVWGLLKKG